jgi:hypothetical protein
VERDDRLVHPRCHRAVKLRHFFDLLVDADVANNQLNWRWSPVPAPIPNPTGSSTL